MEVLANNINAKTKACTTVEQQHLLDADQLRKEVNIVHNIEEVQPIQPPYIYSYKTSEKDTTV